MTALALAPGMRAPWMAALEGQLAAQRVVE